MHLKLKGSPIICLVGMMGSGKSTVGQLLAQRLGWTFVDLDDEIERAAGRRISDIFGSDGEGYFRQLEAAALREQCHQAQHGRARVVALGGGAFVNQNNRELLELGGVSVWLECPMDRLWRRVEGMEHRPLARERAQFERLYEEREGSYRMADFTVSADTDQPDEIVQAILRLKLF